MIVALLALAAAMMIAGVTAVVEGFPYVRLESGMAMVYGGAVVGSSGVLLLGLAVVASGLKRVERAVRGILPVLPAEEAPARVEEPAHDPLVDEFNLVIPPPAEPVERPRIEPSLAPPAREPRPSQPQPDLPILGLSMLQPGEERAPEPRVAPPIPETVRTAPPSPRPSPLPEPANAEVATLRSSLDAVHEPAPRPERTAVGRYSSGGNTYVMFDDGAIEADTPNGRFTFASLDELKAFVDGGGERNARGAA
jgi:hypothetical protein